MARTVEVLLLSKPGCHLCDEAREIIQRVIAQCDQFGVPVVFKELSILSDPQLAKLHAEDIPVVRIAGKQHAVWRVDADRLHAAIIKASRVGLLARSVFRDGRRSE